MGALVGLILQGYLKYLANLDMDWVIFLLIGLSIGVFSGFARQQRKEYTAYGNKLIDTLRESENQLISTGEKYKNLLDQANEVIFLLDEKCRFVEMNVKFEEILGYFRADWIGRLIYDIIAPNDRDEAIKYCWETLKGGTPRFNLKVIHTKGMVVHMALANSPVKDSDGKVTGIMVIARDISEEKKIEELQNKFVSHVSHELRTPLSAIKEFIALLIDEIPGNLNEAQADYCCRVRTNIDRLTKIIDNLLLISSMDEGKVILEKKLVDMRDLIKQVGENLKITAEKKMIRLKTESGDKISQIYLDPDRIVQVLNNLVYNAIKFTPEGGKIIIGLRDSGDKIIFWVKDNGIGIRAEDQERIFDRFQQIRGREFFGKPGSGLGLAISKEITSLHRGEIKVASQVGVGSTFTVSLPKAQAPLVLLVDDDPDLVEMYKEVLSPLHYRISSAANGEEAVVKAFKEIPDLIILDIIMPKMNGYEVLGRLKQSKLTCNIPVIILTGYGLDQDRLDHLAKESMPTLSKPIMMNEFIAAVTNILENNMSVTSGYTV